MSRILNTVLALAALWLASTPALAQPGVESRSIKVFYGDLDLSKPVGGANLLKHIELAAQKACRSSSVWRPQGSRSEAGRRREATDHAVHSANQPLLTLAWSSKYPTTQMAAR